MNTRKQHGFTLIELLGVIAIIAIILSIGIGGAMKMSAAASRRETKARLVLLLEAIDAYAHDGPTGEYPAAVLREGKHCGYKCYECDRVSNPNAEFAFVKCSRSRTFHLDSLYKELMTVKECKNILFRLPDNAINKLNYNMGNQGNPISVTLVSLLDSYEQPIVIAPHGGLGGPPTLISLGADVKFRTDDDIFADR